MAKKYSLMEMREASRKNSIKGPGSYANTDLAKARGANYADQQKAKDAAYNKANKTTSFANADAAKARDAQHAANQRKPVDFANSEAAKRSDKNYNAKVAGLSNTTHLKSNGGGGGNPCHDASNGQFC